jgi:hypothetical protein
VIELTVVQKPPLQVFVPLEQTLACVVCLPEYVVLEIGNANPAYPDKKISIPGSVSIDLAQATYTIKAVWHRGWFGEGETVLNTQISYPDIYLIVVHTVLRTGSTSSNGWWWWPFALPVSTTLVRPRVDRS